MFFIHLTVSVDTIQMPVYDQGQRIYILEIFSKN